jgi:phosphoglucosamine mutase
LLRYPVTVYDCNVLPTPAMAHLMQCMQHTAGASINGAIIISASHNPFQDNGIKVMNAQGKLSANDELIISSLICQPATLPTTTDYGCAIPYTNAQADYCAAITSHFAPKFLTGITVVCY